jgi:multidrug transporter EmrE-like cation transporter
MTNIMNFVYLAVFTTMLAAGQLLFKVVGLSIRGQSLADGLLAVVRQPALYAALFLYGFATCLWIWILSRVPLSMAYPWVAVGVALVPLLSWWLFDEQVTMTFWLGILLIIVGIIVTQYSVSAIN